jgi:hypothetical protein
VAPFGTFWHLLAPFGTDLGLGKKSARIGKAGNGLRTFENVFAG